jgi:hypothetical protein
VSGYSNLAALYEELKAFFKENPGWSGEDEIRTSRELLEALKQFFKDNPGWE